MPGLTPTAPAGPPPGPASGPAPVGPSPGPSSGLLRDRGFVTFWAGETVSATGVQISELALLLTAVVTLRASAFEIGLLNVARYTPFVVVSLFAGVWFDRHRRRPALIASNAGRALLLGLVPLAVLSGVLSIGLLYVIGFLLGALTVVFDVGSLSYLPGLVSQRHLTEANSKVQASYALAGIGGPGLGGLLIGILTAPITLFFSSATYLASAVSLILISRPEPEPEATDETPSIRTLIGEGIRAVFGNSILRNLATQSAVFNLFENVVTTIFAVYAIRSLGLSAGHLGLILGAGAVGALVGAALSNRITRLTGPGTALRLSTLAGCVSPVLLLIPRSAGPVALVILATGLAVHGASLTVFNVNALTLRQGITPTRLLGRMNASYRLLLFGTIPLGALLGGALASAFGLRAALIIGVCGLAGPIAWIPFSPVFALKNGYAS
jgi:hypothetical protein